MRKLTRRSAATCLAAIAAIALVACGAEEAPGPSSDEGQDTIEGTSLDVTATDFSFSPDTISLDMSEDAVVILTNEGDTAHTFTSDELEIDIEAAPGGSQESAFTAPDEDATYSFYCRFHPGQMTGKVIIGTGGEGVDDSDTGEGAGENDTGIDY